MCVRVHTCTHISQCDNLQNMKLHFTWKKKKKNEILFC